MSGKVHIQRLPMAVCQSPWHQRGVVKGWRACTTQNQQHKCGAGFAAQSVAPGSGNSDCC